MAQAHRHLCGRPCGRLGGLEAAHAAERGKGAVVRRADLAVFAGVYRQKNNLRHFLYGLLSVFRKPCFFLGKTGQKKFKKTIAQHKGLCNY
jgi:hypothetical protein